MSDRVKLRGPGGNASGGKAASQQAMLQILAGFAGDERRAAGARQGAPLAARRAWCGHRIRRLLSCRAGQRTQPGDRFFSGMMLGRGHEGTLPGDGGHA